MNDREKHFNNLCEAAIYIAIGFVAVYFILAMIYG